MCSTRECSTIGDCPFSYTDRSEYVQNLGCLPTPVEILSMRVHSGKTWACHSNPDKPCRGAIMRLKELGYDSKVIDRDLLTEEDDWAAHTRIDEKFYDDIRERDMEHLLTNFQKSETFLQFDDIRINKT